MTYWYEYDEIFHGRWPTPYRALPESAAEGALLEGYWLPCEECVEVCETHGRPTAQARYFHELRDHETGITLHCSVMDVYWSCPHAEVFYVDHDRPCYVNEDGIRYRTWADLGDEAETSPEALAKAAAKEAALKAAVTLDESAADFMVQHVKKVALDADYAAAVEAKGYVESIEEKKRAAGKSWVLDKKLVCKYAARNHRNVKTGKLEKELVYTFANPLLAGQANGTKGRHVYTECWFWEYVDPKTRAKKCPHDCNCFHPGQSGWEDEWLWNRECAGMWDRFDDWFCFFYDEGLKQWLYDEKRTIRQADRVRSTRQSGERSAPKNEAKEAPKTTGGAQPQKKPAVMGGRFASARQGDDDGWTTVAPAQDARKAPTKTVWEQKARR
jgi:hypothetical protein